MNDEFSFSWDKEVDIIVIGTGFSGLAAAIEANNAGSDVIILEKLGQIGGNSIIAGGCMNAVHPKRQSTQNIEDSLDHHFEQTWSGGGYRCDPDRIHAVLNEGLNTFNWMEKMGVEWTQEVIQMIGGLWPRTHVSVGRGKNMILALKNQVETREIPILLEHKVIQLLREKPTAGDVLGVKVQTSTQEFQIRALKGVINASGGFAASKSLVSKYDHRLKDLRCTGSKGATGELIVLSQDIGADVVGMDHIQCLPNPYDIRTGKRYSYRVLRVTDIPHILYINFKGERIVNADASRDAIRDAILSQLEQCGLIICDDKLRELNGLDLEDTWNLVKSGKLYGGNSVEELAGSIGIPPTILSNTVTRFNSFVEMKKDPDFSQSPHMLEHRFDTPPFWGIVMSMANHYTCGGLRVGGEKWTQVIDRWDSIIPRYYAAGEVTGGFHGTNRLGCNAILECIVAGRWAGIAAAKTSAAL